MVVLIKQIIIVSDELYIDNFEEKISHEDKYKEYSTKNNLDDGKYKNGFNWGRFLALKGLMNLYTVDENLVLFIPLSLSELQSKWLMNNKKNDFQI